MPTGYSTVEEATVEARRLSKLGSRTMYVMLAPDGTYQPTTISVGRYHAAEHDWKLVSIVDPTPVTYEVARCPTCNGVLSCQVDNTMQMTATWCERCHPRDNEGRLIRAAADVMRAQRQKGIAKYKSTLEDQNGYTVGGMIDMVAEELADGSVYVQKVREMYLALLDEIEQAVDDKDPINCVLRIVKRERGNV